jgi:branched-subunit amino acid transport protein
VTWPLLLAMAAGTYLLRLIGLVLAHRGLPAAVAGLLPLLPAALLAALVVTNTVVTDDQLAVDERLAGVVVAGLLALWGRGLATVVVAGVATTALLRFVLGLL